MDPHFTNQHPAFDLVTGDRIKVSVRNPACEEMSLIREEVIFVRLGRHQTVFVYVWGSVVEIPFNQIHFEEC